MGDLKSSYSFRQRIKVNMDVFYLRNLVGHHNLLEQKGQDYYK